MDNTTIAAIAYRAVMLERIKTLRRNEKRWKNGNNAHGEPWAPSPAQYAESQELRSLLRLKHEAEDVAAKVIERYAPDAEAAGDHHIYPGGVGK